ncbi:MAG: Alkyl hydroperoxide reductase subunit C [bacterium ADurb.Bin429]|nr:MAG: Alkyl hydroperoxide reductase subunit C [bacterium ADurb.Bin429]
MLDMHTELQPLVGQFAPSFVMDASGGQHVTLEQYRGRWLVLLFYPRDFTFICPTELLAFSEAQPEFRALNAEVLAVSTDSAFVHDAWVATPPEQGGVGPLTFPLAADVTHAVSRSYGVYDARQGLSLRAIFIVDPEGRVQYQVVHNLNVGRNVDEVLRVLAGMQTGGLCPVNWRPGQPLLPG